MTAARLLPLLAVVACHRPAPPPPPRAPGPVAPPGLPALFAGLFAGDRTLTYELTTSATTWDDDGAHPTTTTGVARCRVAIARVGAITSAVVRCPVDDPVAPAALAALAGAYLTDGQHLWRRDVDLDVHDPAELAIATAPTAAPPALDATPAARADHHVEEADGVTYVTDHRVEPRGDGWCLVVDDKSTDAFGGSWCLSAARGIVEVTAWESGDPTRDERARLRAP